MQKRAGARYTCSTGTLLLKAVPRSENGYTAAGADIDPFPDKAVWSPDDECSAALPAEHFLGGCYGRQLGKMGARRLVCIFPFVYPRTILFLVYNPVYRLVHDALL